MSLLVVVNESHFGLVVATGKHASWSFIPVVARNLEALEFGLWWVGAKHFFVLSDSLAKFADVVDDAQAEHHIVLHAECDANLEFSSFLHNEGMFFCLIDILL